MSDDETVFETPTMNELVGAILALERRLHVVSSLVTVMATLMTDEQRQIAFMQMDHSIATITPSLIHHPKMTEIHRAASEDLLETYKDAIDSGSVAWVEHYGSLSELDAHQAPAPTTSATVIDFKPMK